jgi:hypothetical protein
MKRDMDLVRRIAIAVGEQPFGKPLQALEGVTPEDFITHVAWMAEGDLLKANVQEGSGSMARYAIVHRLTWAGCEFLDTARNETLWAKAKDNVLKPGMSFTFDLLTDWLKAEVMQGLPTLRRLA